MLDMVGGQCKGKFAGGHGRPWPTPRVGWVSRSFSWGFGSPVFYHELWRTGTISPASSCCLAAPLGLGASRCQ